MKEKQIYIPTFDAESWKYLLADPEKHWKTGYSAKSAANSWERAKGIPKEIYSGLQKCEDTKNAELLLAIPEFKVELPGGTRASQNDIFVITSNETGLTAVTVEAKAKEDFDVRISSWLKDASEGKHERLSFLKERIRFPNLDSGELRYQLFHRLASAVIMAEKFHAKNALMIIQSFVESDKKNHYHDFEQFVKAYVSSCTKNQPILLAKDEKINIYVMWIYSTLKTA